MNSRASSRQNWNASAVSSFCQCVPVHSNHAARVVAVTQPVLEAAGEYSGDAVLSDDAIVEILRLANDDCPRFLQPSETGSTCICSHNHSAAVAASRLGSPYVTTMSMAVRLPRLGSPMSWTPQSLMPSGWSDRSSSRLRPRASEEIRQAPVPGWCLARAAEDVRHPRIKILQREIVDVAPERLAVVALC